MQLKHLGPCQELWLLRASIVSDCVRPQDWSPPGSSVMRLSRQEHWSGLPFPPPGDLPNPGVTPASLTSPALAGGFFTTSAAWEAPVSSNPLPVGTDLHSDANLAGKLYLVDSYYDLGFPGGSDGKEPACSGGDPGSTPGSRRSPGEGKSYPLQCSCLVNSMNRAGLQFMGLQKSQT